MYKMSPGYLVSDHSKAIKVHGFFVIETQKMSIEAVPFGQGWSNSNSKKNKDCDGLKYITYTKLFDDILKGAEFPFVFARTHSIFLKNG